MTHNVNEITGHHCVTLRDENLSSTAHFLRDSVILHDTVGRFGFSRILSRDELN